MSKWTDIRDELVGNLNFDKVTEDMKQELTRWFLETLFPLAESSAVSFVAETKKQAKDEVGWCKIRDLVVLPMLINGGLWFVKTALEKTMAETKKPE